MRITDRPILPSSTLMREATQGGGQSFRLPQEAPPMRAAVPLAMARPVLASQSASVLARRREALGKGRDVLAGLDRLRLATLGGGNLRAVAEALSRDAQDMTEGDDPALDDVLEAIRLRADVELAKLSRR